jgi:hypothetical protein
VKPGRIALAVMAKAPVAGAVKTRLCPPLRPDEAATLARCFLEDRVEQVAALPAADPVVAYAPAGRGREVCALLPAGVRLLPQAAGDLGVRLDALLSGLLAEGYAGAIALGTDTPTLPTAYVEQACAALAAPDGDVVLGPSEDGGYYLIGLRRPAPALFDAMRWSTATVCAETLARARAAGRRVRLLPRWFDVDRPPDLARLRAPAGPAAFTPRRTLAYLAALGR